MLHVGVGYRALLWFYNRWQALTGGKPYPFADGLLPKGERTPTGQLDLQVGEWVQVKSADEIRATLGPDSKNRGLLFDPEMVKFCGERHQVERRVLRLIDEPSGKMIEMKYPCIVLRDAQCRGECTPRRYACPRGIDSYWREIWLSRAPERWQTTIVNVKDVSRHNYGFGPQSPCRSLLSRSGESEACVVDDEHPVTRSRRRERT